MAWHIAALALTRLFSGGAPAAEPIASPPPAASGKA